MNTGWRPEDEFVLEIRGAEDNVSINNGGRTQGALLAIEAEVKDQARFPGGWAYFSFGGAPNLAPTAAPLPTTASCYSCHKANTAVEQTFVQFYPTLMEVARRMGTVRADYDPTRKPNKPKPSAPKRTLGRAARGREAARSDRPDAHASLDIWRSGGPADAPRRSSSALAWWRPEPRRLRAGRGPACGGSPTPPLAAAFR